jgi:heme-degrading monooxygenase HmoA
LNQNDGGRVTQISVINSIVVPDGMNLTAETIRNEYVNYFKAQAGFVSSTFYRAIAKEQDQATKYVNIVVWESIDHFNQVVNKGFGDVNGENEDGMRVLGKGFPEPIVVSPGQYITIAEDIG